MAQGGDDGAGQIAGGDGEGGGVQAGVEADLGPVQHRAVDDQTDALVRVVHQTQNAQRAGGDIQQGLHLFVGCEAQPRAAQSLGEILGLEDLVALHEQQIEVGLLAVGQQKILADRAAEGRFDLPAQLHRGGGGVVGAAVRNAQPVEQGVAFLFLGGAFGKVRRRAVLNNRRDAGHRR